MSDEPGERHGIESYVNANSRLDPGDNLSNSCHRETEELRANTAYIDSLNNLIREQINPIRVKAAILNSDVNASEVPSLKLGNADMQNALQSIPGLYPKDPFFSQLHQCPNWYNKFESCKEYLWTKNCRGKQVVCILGGMLNGKSIHGSIINTCHTTLGHLGPQKMLEYVRCWFWWPKISADVKDFCKSCGQCQVMKSSRQHPPGWVHTMPIPRKPWESIGMDFSGPYPEVKGFNYVLLVICRMTCMVHIIPTCTNMTAKQVAELYVREIVRLHSIPESIISDRDTKFTSQFWMELSHLLGQRLLMSSSYHPQTDGSSEQAIQTMSQILHMLVLDFGANWVEELTSAPLEMELDILSRTSMMFLTKCSTSCLLSALDKQSK